MFQNKNIRALLANQLFNGIDTSTITSYFNSKNLRTEKEGSIIYKSGDEILDLFLVIKGEVKIKFSNSPSNALITKSENEFFGEAEILRGTSRNSSALAITDSVLYIIGKDELHELVQGNEKIYRNLKGKDYDSISEEIFPDSEQQSDLKTEESNVSDRPATQIIESNIESDSNKEYSEPEVMKSLLDETPYSTLPQDPENNHEDYDNSNIEIDGDKGLLEYINTEEEINYGNDVELASNDNPELTNEKENNSQSDEMLVDGLSQTQEINEDYAPPTEVFNNLDGESPFFNDKEVSENPPFEKTNFNPSEYDSIFETHEDKYDIKSLGSNEQQDKSENYSFHPEKSYNNNESAVSLNEEINRFITYNLTPPVQAIKRYSSILKNLTDQKEINQISEMISKQADSLVGIVESSLDFAENRISINATQQNVSEVMEDILLLLKDFAENNRVKLFWKIETTAIAGIDKDKFYNACYQIVKNSCESMPDGGNLFVTVVKEADQVKLEFIDEGPGIPSSIRGDIFEPLSTHGKENASGLGLSITKKIVEDHDGYIFVESDLGEGTKIIISLPILE